MKILFFSWLFLVPMFTLFLNFCVFVVCGQCMGNQRSLLLEFKDNLTFNPAMSTKLVKWNQSADCCSWEGVTCNEGRVIGLNLTSESIFGELNNSSSLFGLQYLRNLSLADNDFNFSQIPSEFGKLANLSYLNLQQCNLIGSIPDSIASLTHLVYLDMSYNHFNGSILSSIAGLTHLVYLDIKFNSFSGPIPSSIAGLTQLIHLDMSINNFSGPIPIFNKCKNLIEVHLSYNNLSSEITSTRWEELLNLEILELGANSLNGNIPVSLFSLPSLQRLDLSSNQFSGQLKEFSNVSSHVLEHLYLGDNKLEGPIPMFIFEFRFLEVLSLSSNKFNGSLDLSVIQKFKSLWVLSLSYNNLSVEYNGFNLSLSSFPRFSMLELASCKLKKFPDFLKNQSNLFSLDLSHNQIYGKIPNWIWKHDSLSFLNLSYNNFWTLEGPIFNVSLLTLDLRSNRLQGQLPIIPSSYLDFSRNNFHSVLPASIGQSLASTTFLSLSGNKFYGSIPRTICNATKLELLDLSNNSFSGTIPQCLIEMSGTLEVLSLRTNKLNGTIPDAFPDNCSIQVLALNKNQLEGVLPKSLAKCIMLEVLDIGNNHIKDMFPFYLKNKLLLRVLVLRSNKFYGSIAHPELNATWPSFPKLQILDVASNNFTGNLPIILLSYWMEMVDPAHEAHSDLSYLQHYIRGFYYRDTITITSKGLAMELVKILTIFNTLDFSCNNFYGSIPGEIGEIALLYILNLSHNALTGQIPTSLGKLSNLESLDLSNNELTGKIPVQLANGLIFLSVLDLSFNQLMGQIPLIKQFATFPEASFEGNRRLCGSPLKSKCTHEEPQSPPPTYEESHGSMIEWNYISAELGFVFGFGIIIGPLMFWRRWRIWYYKHIDDIVFRIFPQLYLRKEHRRRQAFSNQERRH